MQFDLQNFLPYRLSLLTNTVSQGIAAAYHDTYDISITEWRILAVLGRFPGLTASEVVGRTAMDKVAISRAVKSMMEKGLVSRSIDQADRRRRQLHLTPEKGQKVLGEIIPLARSFEDQLLKALDPAEAKAFHQTMEKLQEQADKLL